MYADRSLSVALLHAEWCVGVSHFSILARARFLGLAALGFGTVVGGLACFLNGVTIERGILDPVGSSANADERVALFQTLSGFFSAVVGLLLEKYFKIIIAVMHIYLTNRSLFPGDEVAYGPPRTKLWALFWFTPLVMYVVNSGFSSVFVEHKTDKFVRAFADADLVDTTITTKALPKGTNKSTNVVDTVLRKLVTNVEQPFQINETSICSTLVNGTTKVDSNLTFLPSILDLQTTSVTFAFPGRLWNLDAMPQSLTPTHSITIDQRERDKYKDTQGKLDAFLKASGVTYTIIGELLIQGQTLHGKATTDSNMFESYKCDPKIGTIADDASNSDETEDTSLRARARSLRDVKSKRRLQTEGSESGSSSSIVETVEVTDEDEEVPSGDTTVVDGMTVDKETGVGMCYGMGNYLADMVDLTQPTNQSFTNIFDSIYGFAGIAFWNITVTIETFTVSPQLNLTTLTLDLPYNDERAEYIYVNDAQCDLESDTFLDADEERLQYPNDTEYQRMEEYMCSGRYVAVDAPFQMCGETSCLLGDYSPVVFMNKQIQLTPYMANCRIGRGNVRYDPEYTSWSPPNCTAQKDSAFLYTVGSYFEGDFSVRGKTRGPVITNTRRHYVLTFAKLDWRFEDLIQRFDASYAKDADGCRALLHSLQNSQPGTNGSRVLIVGETTIPQNFQRRTLKNPLPLVVLREPKIYNGFAPYTYLVYEYLDISRLSTTHKESDGLGLS